ncbi:MAG TPA: ABC transporter permease [Candidatus Hydrogenedentes bacterium]|nr:ABC transporter permease [Candidatus Hydrogenedentota bacterium]
MNLGRFVLRNVFRNKRRAVLTVLSIAFSLFLLLFLLTVLNGLLNPVTQDEAAQRVIVRRSTSLAEMMPISYLDKIKQLPEVEWVVPLQWVNGLYIDANNVFANFATDPEHIFDIYSEQHVAPEALTAFKTDRTAAIAGKDLMDRYGWEPGQKITLLGTIFPVDLELTIVGEYTSPEWQNSFYLRYDYFNEALDKLNQVGCFVVKTTSKEAVPRVADAVDAMFRNTSAETKTETEKAFVIGFISMLGNVKTIIGSVSIVVMFTMLLVSISTMSMAVRERVREVAILRAIGYPKRIIVGLVVGEALFISVLGTVIGILLAESMRFVDMNVISQGFLDRFAPKPAALTLTIFAGLGMGLISGIVPAVQIARTNIVTAMRSIE